MKLDLNKAWVRSIVHSYNINDGCGFIRAILFRYSVYAVMFAGATALVLGMLIATIGSAIMAVYDPAFLYLRGPELMTYFGPEWYHATLAVLFVMGIVVWAVLIFCALMAGIVIGVVSLLDNKQAIIQYIPTTLSTAYSNTTEAVSASLHKYCPHIELVAPADCQGFVQGAQIERVEEYLLSDTGERIPGPIGVIKSAEITEHGIALVVNWEATATVLAHETEEWIHYSYGRHGPSFAVVV